MSAVLVLYLVSCRGLVPIGIETADKIALCGINDSRLLLEIDGELVRTGNSERMKAFQIATILGSVVQPPQIRLAIRLGCTKSSLAFYLVKIEGEWVIGKKAKTNMGSAPPAPKATRCKAF